MDDTKSSAGTQDDQGHTFSKGEVKLNEAVTRADAKNNNVTFC